MRYYLRTCKIKTSAAIQGYPCYIAIGRAAHIYYPGLRAWFILRPAAKDISSYNGVLPFEFTEITRGEWFAGCGKKRCILEMIEDVLGFRLLHVARYLVSHGFRPGRLKRILQMDNQPEFGRPLNIGIQYEAKSSG